MTLIQTSALNGSILTANRQQPQAEFSVRVEDSVRENTAIAYLTADQAADLLESLVLLGVRVTPKAENALAPTPERLVT